MCPMYQRFPLRRALIPTSPPRTAPRPPPDLAVSKFGPSLARPGNRVPWNITWVNQTLQPASGVYLVETLPDKVTFVSVTAPSGVTPYYHAGPSSPVPVFDPNNPLGNGWSATPTMPVGHIALLVGAMAGKSGPFTAEVAMDVIDPNFGSPTRPPPGAPFTTSGRT